MWTGSQSDDPQFQFWISNVIFYVLLEMIDREAPVVRNCPHDVHVHLNALEPYVNAKWVEPTFKDNIAVTHVLKSKVETLSNINNSI